MPAAMGRMGTAKSSQISHISALLGGKIQMTAQFDSPKFHAVEPDRLSMNSGPSLGRKSFFDASLMH